MTSNMAPGSENDPRSGCDDDTMDCPACNGDGFTEEHNRDDPLLDGEHVCQTCPTQVQCHYCEASGVVSEREYRTLKELEKLED